MSMHGPIATHRSAAGVPTGRLATWWLLASEIFIFGGLIACFLLFKLSGTPGFEDASLTSVTAGAVNTFVLLTSSLSIVLAHAAIEKGDQKKSEEIKQKSEEIKGNLRTSMEIRRNPRKSQETNRD